MAKYALAELEFAAGYLDFHATDPSCVDWFLSEIKRIAPDCKVKNRGERGVGVDNLGRAAAWRMLQQLCENGWEPFAYSPFIHHLRLKQD